MAKTIEIPAGKVCDDCENFDQNLDEVTDTYPLATEVIDNDGYAPNLFLCYSCHEVRVDAWYHIY